MHLKKQRISALFIFFLLLGMTTSIFSAQKPEDVLAEVNGEALTRAQYEAELQTFIDIANPQAAAHFSTPDGKKQFLTQIIEIITLQKKAEKEGLNKSKEYEEAFHEMAVARLAAETMQQIIKTVSVKDEDAKAFYEKNKNAFVEAVQYKVFQIAVEGEKKALELKKQIDSGKDFSEIAKAESVDQYKAAGGDRGLVAEGAIDPQLLEVLKKLKQNEVSAPVKVDEDLFVLVKYTDKKEGEAKDYASVESQIKRDLLNTQQRDAYDAEIEKLKKDLSFELNEKAAESLRKENITNEEKEATLFKYAGKEVKVAEAEQELQQIPPFIRPQILGGEGLNDFLKQFIARFLGHESVEQNFKALSEKYPVVVKDVARRTVIRFLLDQKLGSLTVEDKEIEDFYKKNSEQFSSPAQIKASHILVSEEAAAKEIMATLVKDPTKFADLAREKSSCPSGKSAGGDLGSFGQGQMVPEFDQACQNAEIGKLAGPVKTQFGYHIIRVDERTEAGTQKLEDVREQIRSQLLPDKQKEVFTKLVEELKKEFNVIVHQDKL